MNNDLISKSKLFDDLENHNIPFNEAINSVIYYQPTVNQWIDVDNLLPENDKQYKDKKVIDVLVTTKRGYVTKVRRYKDTYYGKDLWYWGRLRSDIIAWMPLPEPYKKEV